MFHCSNYSKIWDTLTSHYDEVPQYIWTLQYCWSEGEYPGAGRWQVRGGPCAGAEECWEVPRPATFLLWPTLHFQWLLSLVQRSLSLTSLLSGKKGMPCFKLDEESLDRCMGGNKGRNHPELSEETLHYLRKMYKPMLEKFNQQSGAHIRLSWYKEELLDFKHFQHFICFFILFILLAILFDYRDIGFFHTCSTKTYIPDSDLTCI